jgi:hypothetical protein
LILPAPMIPGAFGAKASGPRRAGRTVLRLAVAGVCLILGGCIYLRLLALKNQLADFDRYFGVDLRQGVAIICRQPVLLDEDMAFFKLVPETRRRLANVERWHFRWVKAYQAPGEEPQNYEVSVDFMFVDHKLARVLLPERLFVFVPKHFFLTIVRAFGHAQVDQARRTASANVHEVFAPGMIPPPPSDTELAAMLGAPESKTETAAGIVWNYRYQAASADQRSGRIDVTFTLNPATHKARRIQGKIFDLTLDINLAEAPPPPATHDTAR